MKVKVKKKFPKFTKYHSIIAEVCQNCGEILHPTAWEEIEGQEDQYKIKCPHCETWKIENIRLPF